MSNTALEIQEPQTRKEIAAPEMITPMTMIDRALITGAAPETLEKLLALQERWEANQGRKAFDEAMAAAKAEIPVIRKNRTVDFTSSKGRTHYRHEDLAEIAETVNPILSKFGLSYRFRTTSNINEPISVTCIISHRLGYSEENTLVGPPDDSGNKNALQRVGSSLSYLQRMTLKASLGLAASEYDDDGASAGDRDDDRPVSAEQIDAIRKEIAATDTDEESFLKWMDAGSLEDIRASAMPKIMRSFQVKRQRMSS